MSKKVALERFTKFLEDEGVIVQWYENLTNSTWQSSLESLVKHKEPILWTDLCFNWLSTPQCARLWDNINDKWREICDDEDL